MITRGLGFSTPLGHLLGFCAGAHGPTGPWAYGPMGPWAHGPLGPWAMVLHPSFRGGQTAPP